MPCFRSRSKSDRSRRLPIRLTALRLRVAFFLWLAALEQWLCPLYATSSCEIRVVWRDAELLADKSFSFLVSPLPSAIWLAIWLPIGFLGCFPAGSLFS